MACWSPCLLALVCCLWLQTAHAQANTSSSSTELTCRELPNCTQPCKNGLIIPAWFPLPFVNNTQQIETSALVGRAAIYLFVLFYLFLGISIISDRFMSAIEVITSQEKTVVVRGPDGEQRSVQVRIWNETVSNLTLMALGSSCPEIMLSIIEICGNKFEAGELGPGTIVGSAAYNLFVITALCTLVVGNPAKRIKHLRVFFITASWSVFAYLWMYAMLAWISPDVIDLWEAALTFLFFPITVLSAWVVDRKLLFGRFFGKRVGLPGGPAAFASPKHEGEPELHAHRMLQLDGNENDLIAVQPDHEMDDAFYEFERHRREYIELLKDLRKKHPEMSKEKLEEQAQFLVLNRGPKSRAFYRIQATRNLTGGGNVLKMNKIEKKLLRAEEKVVAAQSHIQKVLFEPAHYTVLENIGTFQVAVTRRDGDSSCELLVDYVSEDGTATADSDYLPVRGSLQFAPGELLKHIDVSIIDDDEFEEDEHFYIKLLNLRVRDPTTGHFEPVNVDKHNVQLATPAICTVMILDDDHPGVFQFENAQITFSEACETAEIPVHRLTGARGRVFVPYRSIDGTCVNGVGYHEVKGELVFENDQTEATIRVPIVNEEKYEKSEIFAIELGVPSYSTLLHSVPVSNSVTGSLSMNASSPSDGTDTGFTSPLVSAPIHSQVSLASKYSHHRHHVEFTERFFASFSDEARGQTVNSDQPRLGEHHSLQVVVSESADFKSVIDVLMKKANTRTLIGTSSWVEQFREAVTLTAGDDDDEQDDSADGPQKENGVVETRLQVSNGTHVDGDEAQLATDSNSSTDKKKQPSALDYIMHYASLFWKLLFAFVPPTDYLNGWLCFCVSIMFIGILTAFVGDIASHFGCTVGLKDAVTAITFVALGTSLPDTFASKVAAMHDEYADSSIGNVTGSNAVNVFLGIGAAWLVAAIYHTANGTKLIIKAGSLGFSVTLFCILAVACITVMLMRRVKRVGGELGGPPLYKYLSASFMFSLWIIYIVVSSLQYYGHITAFV